MTEQVFGYMCLYCIRSYLSIYFYYQLKEVRMKQYKETYEYLKLVNEYNKLAKKADRRMRELEELAKQKDFKNVKKYAYLRAKKDIKAWTPPGQGRKKPRWQRNIPFDTKSLKAKIKDIKHFLDSPTSTKRGIIKVYKNRTDAINKKYHTKFTWQTLASYFNTGLYDKTEGYGSKTVLMAMANIQANKKKVLVDLKNHEVTDLKVEDEKIDQTIEKLLSGYGKELKKVLK